MSIFRGGALVDRPDPRDYRVGGILPPAVTIPDAVSYADHVDRIRSQEGSRACTGFALAMCALVWARARGVTTFEFPSPLALYFNGRASDRLSENEPIVDAGARPRAVSRAAQRYGFVPESAWPFSMARVDVDPKFATLRRGSDFTLDAFFRLEVDGPARSRDCRRMLAAGHPFTATLACDDGFNAYVGRGVIGLPAGPVTDLHRVAFVGYRPGAFLFVNSWGLTYGDRGFGWISDERLEHPSTRDLEMVTLVRT